MIEYELHKTDDVAQDMKNLYDIVTCLRDPVDGCPWDREQMPRDIIRSMQGEIYEYVEKRNNYEENKEDMFLFFKKLVKNSYVLKKSYLDTVTNITVKDIYNTINGMKDVLVEKYCVDNIYLYGSFAKGTNRHDSDVDLLVKLSADMPYDDRVTTIEQLKQLFFETFKRFTDIEEVREFFTEDFIKEATKIKRIF